MLCMCVCACAHLHTCAFTVVKTWINGRPSSRAAQRSDAAHFSTLCCQMPPSHTHTYIQLRCLQNRLQPQCNPKKKQRCRRHRLQPRPRRSALLSLSSTLILSLPHSLALFILCIAYLEARSADCCCCQAANAAAVYSSVALSHTLSLSL